MKPYLVFEGCLSKRQTRTPIENWKKKKKKKESLLMKLLHSWIWVEINHSENEWVHTAVKIRNHIKGAIYHILAKLHKSVQQTAKLAHAQYKGRKEFQKTNTKQMFAWCFLMSYLSQSRLAPLLRQTQNWTQPDRILKAWLQMSSQYIRCRYLQIHIFLWITEDKDTEEHIILKQSVILVIAFSLSQSSSVTAS